MAKRLAWSALRMIAVFFLLIHGFLYLMQDRMLFFPRPLDPDVRAAVRRALPAAEEVTLKTADGHRLQGLFVPGGPSALIYFGGNAEEVTGFALDAPELPGVSLALFNYRGYGGSTGSPGEKALFADALAIYDHVASRPGVDAKRIVVMGRSLGSGVATYLATQRPVSAVILVTPYDSIAAVAQASYPFVLVDLLLRHRFDSLALAPSVQAPVLILAGAADTLIPPTHAAVLAKAWKGPVTSVVLPRAGHNDIGMHDGYWRAIRAFLAPSSSAAGRGAPGH
ncbi:MAG TPA: alpha/beta fold hydrolase [Burkholderiales bacterium]|nr:alpha/beta fold hydrolase [Burkholderiales bacterium]